MPIMQQNENTDKKMIKILVASRNPVKELATREAMQMLLGNNDFIVMLSDTEIDSGVSAQPLSQAETAKGAITRLQAINKTAGFDYFIAIEGGIFSLDVENGSTTWFECACAAVSTKGSPKPAIAFAPAYPIPQAFIPHLKAGKDLTEVMNIVTGLSDIGKANGFNGWLTGDQLDRKEGSALAVLLALHGLNKG